MHNGKFIRKINPYARFKLRVRARISIIPYIRKSTKQIILYDNACVITLQHNGNYLIAIHDINLFLGEVDSRNFATTTLDELKLPRLVPLKFTFAEVDDASAYCFSIRLLTHCGGDKQQDTHKYGSHNTAS